MCKELELLHKALSSMNEISQCFWHYFYSNLFISDRLGS